MLVWFVASLVFLSLHCIPLNLFLSICGTLAFSVNELRDNALDLFSTFSLHGWICGNVEGCENNFGNRLFVYTRTLNPFNMKWIRCDDRDHGRLHLWCAVCCLVYWIIYTIDWQRRIQVLNIIGCGCFVVVVLNDMCLCWCNLYFLRWPSIVCS